MLSMVSFIILFLLIVNRWWIFTFLSSLKGTKMNGYDLKNPKLLRHIYHKTGVKLSKIKILDTQKVWGLMGGLIKPYMVLAKSAYESFSPKELEWLLFHEAGHHVLGHGLKQVVLHGIFIIVGMAVLRYIPRPILFSPLLAIVSAILYIQIVRRFEYEANTFALGRMRDPSAVIHIQQMAKKRWTSRNVPMKNLRQKLFSVWTPKIYEDLVIQAKSLL